MLTDEQIASLKATHGDRLYLLSAGGYDVAVRVPTPEMYERYVAMGAAPEQRHLAPGQLFRDCVVAPDQEAVRKMLADKPALAILFGGKCSEIAGASERVEVKKA